MSYQAVPAEIQREVVRQQTKMGWPDYVPKYAELPHGQFVHFKNVTVAMCEQLVEHHTRKASHAIEIWMRRRYSSQRVLASQNILYARLYRCRYISLIGKTDSTEADMPFPCMSKEELRKHKGKEST